MEDADLEGVLSPEEIAAAIAGSRPTFITFAHTLQDAGMEAFTAIEARDADALLRASEALDQACELCHRTYWHPNTAEPIRASDSAP